MVNLKEPSINYPAGFFPILFVEVSVLSGGWVPPNSQHFVEKESFHVEVLF